MWLWQEPLQFHSVCSALESSQCGRGQSTNKFRSVQPAHLIQDSIPHHGKAVILCQPPFRLELPESKGTLHYSTCCPESLERGEIGVGRPLGACVQTRVCTGSKVHRSLKTQRSSSWSTSCLQCAPKLVISWSPPTLLIGLLIGLWVKEI